MQGTALSTPARDTRGSPCLAAPARTQHRLPVPTAKGRGFLDPRNQQWDNPTNPSNTRSGVKHLHRRSCSLPGLAGIGEAFQRLKRAGAFGCQEVEVRKALELVVEGSELPESSRSGHQTHGSVGKASELSLLEGLKMPPHS